MSLVKAYRMHGHLNARLDPQLRELAILRTMWRTGQSLEWANHYRLARSIGVTRDDVLAIRTPTPEQDLDGDHALPEAPWFEPGARWSARRVLVHIIAETAQHAGHADIIRESIDGAKTMG